MLYEKQPFYKIPRDLCLIKYRNLPLREYDKGLDEDLCCFPTTSGFYWLKHEGTRKKFIGDLVSFFNILKLETFVFMCDENKPWISKFTSKRTDSKALTKALDYFKAGKVRTKFNGGLLVHTFEFTEFLTHFFMLVRCDGGFSYYHFIDDKNDFVFSLLYSGELNVMTLNKKANKRLHSLLSDTNFSDAGSENSDRIG